MDCSLTFLDLTYTLSVDIQRRLAEEAAADEFKLRHRKRTVIFPKQTELILTASCWWKIKGAQLQAGHDQARVPVDAKLGEASED